MPIERRRLGSSPFRIAPVAMGCWPIAGMTSPGVTREDSLATIRAALDSGINHLDTAFGYGLAGESEQLIAEAVADRRDQVVIATKVGLGWDSSRTQIRDARPSTLRAQCEQSLRRLNTDRVDLLYLHAPDPRTPLEVSAAALRELQRSGDATAVGASNLDLEQLQRFHAICPLAAFQPPYNMLQREIEADILPWCRQEGIAVLVYWPLMKGLLAGKLTPGHTFATSDSRNKYPMFQGQEWTRNLEFVEQLRGLARELDCTVAQLVVRWTIEQPGVTAALCGAKRPDQICETAGAMQLELSSEMCERIETLIRKRGPTVTRNPV